MGKLIDEVKKMEDTRQQWKVKHALCDIVVIVMLSILTGHHDFEEMVIFAEARIDILRQYIELKNGIPHKDTLKRVIAILNPNELNFIFYKWLSEIVTVKSKKTLSELERIIAFDGKTLCGSNDINNKALHILTAFDTDNELVLGQLPVDEKTNEITVMPDLIDLLDLKDTIITADALNCQKEIVEKIVDKKGNYVLAVKGNKGELYDSIVDYFDDKTLEIIKAKEECYFCNIEKAHSQIEKREYFLINHIDYLKENQGKDYKKLNSVGLCKKTITNANTGEITTENRYYIMSIFDVELFARTVRKEWMIENNLHWHLDYTLKEDASTIIDKKVAFNLNIIRKSVLTMLKNVEFKKKYSLKNKITYINDNFVSILPNVLDQLSTLCK